MSDPDIDTETLYVLYSTLIERHEQLQEFGTTDAQKEAHGVRFAIEQLESILADEDGFEEISDATQPETATAND